MKSIFAKIGAIAATTAALSVAVANNPTQAIELNFNWQGNAGYSAIGSFSYNETTAPTIISEQGSGATNFLQSLSVSFLDPSNNPGRPHHVNKENIFSIEFKIMSLTLTYCENLGDRFGA